MVLPAAALPWYATAVLAATVLAVLVRPAGLPEGVWGAIGAALAVAGGALSGGQALRTVADSWNILLFFLGLMAVAGLAEEAGVFATAGGIAVRTARGSPARLFAGLALVGSLLTAVLSNDATALLLTPVVAGLALELGLDPIPYALVTSFVADAASGLLPVGNPVNIIVTDGFGIGLGEYLRVLLPGALAMAVLTPVILGLSLRSRMRADGPALRDGGARLAAAPRPSLPALRPAIVVLGALAVAYLVASATGAPVGPVGCAGALALALVVGSRLGPRRLLRLRRHISVSVLTLVAGLFVVVRALESTGVTGRAVGAILEPVAGRAHLGPAVALVVAAVGCNLVNNLPLALVTVSGIHGAGLPHAGTLALASGLGADVGPNLTPVGSLATLLWLVLLRARGVIVPTATYIRYGAIATLPALTVAAALLALRG